ncbi:uncharacterized protein [Palaemon carinicauda]|uniref:uncharacterized protein isoform X3 n=1 Tax=Palaemon carinicauda TaxID=392227 RepID=UPI0035B6258D
MHGVSVTSVGIMGAVAVKMDPTTAPIQIRIKPSGGEEGLGPSNPITVGHGECLGDVAKNLWTGVKSIEKVYRSWIGVEVRGIVDGSPKALKQPLEVTSVRDTLGLRKLADFRLRFIRRLHASRFLTIY